MGNSGAVVNKRMSFLVSLVWGLTTFLVITVVSGTGVIIYSLHVAERQAGGVIRFLGSVIDDAPNLVAALPPVLSDALHDRRAPEYVERLRVSVSFSDDPHHAGRSRPVLTVHNDGPDLVSLLSMRVVVRDGRGSLLSEGQEWVATPLAVADCQMPGPIMPGATRYLSMRSFRQAEDVTAEYEVTDVRVWVNGQTPASAEADPS